MMVCLELGVLITSFICKANVDFCKGAMDERVLQAFLARPLVNTAPHFRPSEEEFKDPFEYLRNLQFLVGHSGKCSFVPAAVERNCCASKNRDQNSIWGPRLTVIAGMCTITPPESFQHSPLNMNVRSAAFIPSLKYPWNLGLTTHFFEICFVICSFL